jgi:hypothetical protein
MKLPRRQYLSSPEGIMNTHDRLTSLILKHWSRYHPSMLAELQQQNRLQQELEQTAEAFADLMYELVAVKKMEYHQAWELAVEEFLLPEESSSTSPSVPAATSASPTPTASEWVARMKKRKAI